MIKINKKMKVVISTLAMLSALSVGNFAESVKLTPQKAIITGSNVNMRNGPGTNYKAILQIANKGTVVTALEKEGNWYKIDYNDGNKGWVIGDFLNIPSGTVVDTSESRSRESTTNANLSSRSNYTTRADLRRSAIINSAKACLGIKYVWGGWAERGNPNSPDPEDGLDCSGFVYYIFSIYGIKLNGGRSVAANQATEGIEVTKDELKPADLVFFQGPSESSISHVAIYIGENEDGVKQIIHAASSASGVIISNFDTQPNFKTARRIIQD